MKSYAEREVFAEDALAAVEIATAFVARVGNHWGNELRCHELARAVGRLLNLEVVDGRYFAVEHTWLLFRHGEGAHILDVYVPGRFPQVQLIHNHWATSALRYVPGVRRDDIRKDIIEQLVKEMTTC